MAEAGIEGPDGGERDERPHRLDPDRHRSRCHQVGHLVGDIGPQQPAAADDVVDVAEEVVVGGRYVAGGEEQHLGGGEVLLVVALQFGGGQVADGEPVEVEHAHLEGGVHPQELVEVEGVVPLPGHRVDPLDHGVEAVDAVGDLESRSAGAEGQLALQGDGADQPRPRVAPVGAGLTGPGRHQRVRRLHEERPGAAEQRGHLAVDPPHHRVAVEEPVVAHSREPNGCVDSGRRAVPRTAGGGVGPRLPEEGGVSRPCSHRVVAHRTNLICPA